MNEDEKIIIDVVAISRILWSKRKTFCLVWVVVFGLSCFWILPQPRYYMCEVMLAPEEGGSGGDISSLASSFGFNIGGMETSDAIYPILYPDLFESPEFISKLFKINVITYDETVNTDYYTYLRQYQKKNWLTQPFIDMKNYLSEKFSSEQNIKSVKNNEELNLFNMSKTDYVIFTKVKKNVKCSVDKKTDVITISVKDQDKLVCALLADSIKMRLQEFITDYRTKKVREDVKYYQQLTDSAKVEYESALEAYGSYNDSHRDLVLQTYKDYGDKLRNNLDTKLQTYNTFNAQLAAAKAKVQERTPSFTTLKSATIPLKPAGPKRMIFVIGMLFLSTFTLVLWLSKSVLFKR